MSIEAIRRARSNGVAAALMAIVLGLSACGSSEPDEAATQTKEALDSPATAVTSDTDSALSADWETDPQDVRLQVGEQFTYDCPPGGSVTAIWGVEVYTDDSSICSAAVHVGLITPADGGEVTIKITEGLESYESGIANEIESGSWPSWDGSFVFPAALPGSGTFESPAPAPADNSAGSYLSETWLLTVAMLPFEAGDTYTHDCPPGGVTGSVWGTGTYTADSSMCSAGVHAGVITTESGGDVVVTITEGLDEYEASEANGVSSSAWGSYDLSFEVG